jgi:hypothetical protein
VNAVHRLKKALARPDGPVPFSLVITLVDAREILELAEHQDADHRCEECGECVACDPSPCTHRPVCDACFPANCQLCLADIDVDVRGA